MGFIKRQRDKIKHGDRRPSANPQRLDLYPSKESSSTIAETLSSSHETDKTRNQNRQNRDDGPKVLWQVAYNRLSDKDRKILRANHDAQSSQNNAKTLEIVDEVVQLTEKQYEEYRKSGLRIKRGSGEEDINLRDTAQRILDAALSFKDIVEAIVVFDPTGYASSAWTIVSLGLTMTQNHIEIRNALFKSSEFLADILARCAFIEKEHYYNSQLETKNELEKAIVHVYVGILQYTARVRKMQNANIGKRILESVSTVTDHPIIHIQSSIENDEQKLQQWVERDQYLRQSHQAGCILARIDKLFSSIEVLHRKLDLHNLRNAEGASFDSYTAQHDDECLPGTREELIQQVKAWGSSPKGQCIFWLRGMAGTGKSTISRTVARLFQEQGQLGANFFFKRGGGDRGNARMFFSTITRQLITTIPQLVHGVSRAIDADPDISTRSFSLQFEKLISQPLCKMKESRNVVIVIDALDECEGERDIPLLLKILSQTISKSVQLRVFVTTRPELPVRLGFQDENVRNRHCDFVLHDIPTPVVEHDISLFLEHKLKQIEKDRSLPSGWLGDDKFETLVKMSVPLFIFAATVCRVLEDRDLEPLKSLEEILKYKSDESELGGTYLPVLKGLFANHSGRRKRQLVEEFHDVVGTIIILESPLSVISLSKILQTSKEMVNTRLSRLHSVLYIPDNETESVRLFHLSFRDFLLDPEIRQETEFWVDGPEAQQKLTTRCLGIMQHSLKKNICSLPNEGIQRMEIDTDTISRYIPSELQYCCRYWIQHLVQCKDPKDKMDHVDSFLVQHFLHWVEVMCILGYASEVAEGIERLQSVIQDDEKSETSKLLNDARRFIIKHRHIADIAPLQIYCSGLIFTPVRSIIRERFSLEMPKWICRLPKVDKFWNAELETLEGHDDRVMSVAFSQDGGLLASGSSDKNIKLWDPRTGALQQTLKGHKDPVRSVAFSQDGRWLASGSYDKTIKLWDLRTGALQQTLKGHDGRVWSVAFSRDGRWLASGPSDNTIKLWDLRTSALQQTLKGHNGRVWSVAFSQDGRWLASGSSDKTIKLWDLATGALPRTLEDHDDWVRSVAFSQDGRWLASGSDDKTIKLWDLATGALPRTLRGHSDRVRSVAFSQDGRWLASASSDNTIKLWNLGTGALPRTLRGHDDRVWSVAFSQDGRWLASASSDRTIKLWDPTTGAPQQTIEGHKKWVRSVAFSQDGRWLASGSDDKSIKLWDPSTAALQQTLHTQGTISQLKFSEDGSNLITNLGPFSLQSLYGRETPTQTQSRNEVCVLKHEWVALQGKKILWLPPAYRPTCTATRDGMLVMGHFSGRVSFFQFCQ